MKRRDGAFSVRKKGAEQHRLQRNVYVHPDREARKHHQDPMEEDEGEQDQLQEELEQRPAAAKPQASKSPIPRVCRGL